MTLQALHFAVNYTMTSHTLLWRHKKLTPIRREQDGNQRCLWLFRCWLINFASRRKIINQHIVGGTRESHPSVQDLQSTTKLAESWMLQIFDTRMGFPCPSRNVVIDSISPTSEDAPTPKQNKWMKCKKWFVIF